MSKNRVMQTQFTDREHLRAALKATGVPFEEGPVGRALTLHGYGGQESFGSFAIRKYRLDNCLGDIGWRWDTRAGAFEQIADDMDIEHPRTNRFLQQVRREYAAAAATEAASMRGFQWERADLADGSIQIVVTGRI